MRRFTRLTNAFYNFARIHETLRVTPAMQVGLADHVWSLGEIVGLPEAEGARTAA